MVAIATTRFCGGVDHIPVIIAVSTRACSLVDVRDIFGIPKRGTSLYHRAMSGTLWLF